MRVNNWFQTIKTAGGNHGDTLHGQMRTQEAAEVERSIVTLKKKAVTNDLDVLPRWAGEVKRKIYLLPPASRINSMSMFEISQVKSKLAAIKESMELYSSKRLSEITGAHNS